jgi:hypothetical protein
MSWRLARGRAMLRRGLERRGVALSAALLAGLLAEEASAAVPAALAEATARAALLAASGGALAGPAAALADGTARALAPARRKLVAALLALGLLVGGAGVATHRALTAHRPAPPPGEQAKNDEPALPPAPPKDAGDKPEPAAPPVDKPPPHADAWGDPLPPGAVVRLGTQRLRQADGVTAFAFSPDGKRLATGGGDADEWLHVWDVETGRLVRRLPEGGVTLLAFTPDGKTLAVAARVGAAGKPSFRLWDLESGREERRFTRLPFLPDAAAFTPDAKTLFAVLWEKNGVSTWDTATGDPRKTYLLDRGPFSAFALSPDGRTIAVVTHSREKVVLVNTARDTRLEYSKQKRTFTNLAFSPDG